MAKTPSPLALGLAAFAAGGCRFDLPNAEDFASTTTGVPEPEGSLPLPSTTSGSSGSPSAEMTGAPDPDTGSGSSAGSVQGSSTDDGKDSSESSESSESSAPAVCGNGRVEADEDCDDGEESETCDADCTSVDCGDGSINVLAGEQCEGGELAGASCEDLGFDGGVLSCTAECSHDIVGCLNLPEAPTLTFSASAIKQFDFSWALTTGAEFYQIEQSTTLGDPFALLIGDIFDTSVSSTMPLHLRAGASYRLSACNRLGCTSSEVITVETSLAEAAGYFKASNTESNTGFGQSVALSGDGTTMVVGSWREGGASTGIDGDPGGDKGSGSSGAAYVFVRDDAGHWSQQAYIKASNASENDRFGVSVTLSDDGNTLAVGAHLEGGGDGAVNESGAAYLFVRDEFEMWSQEAYIKASNPGAGDAFGQRIALSGNGEALAVAAWTEDGGSNATGDGIDDDTVLDAGAVYVFARSEPTVWTQEAYIKASNAGEDDRFGASVALNGTGDTLVVGATSEDSAATGINGAQGDDNEDECEGCGSGAAYVFVRDDALDPPWSQQAYIKASNTGAGDRLGESISLSSSGDILAVGAPREDSSGAELNNDAGDAGAVYIFTRDDLDVWSQQFYLKAQNLGVGDGFGSGIAMSSNGAYLAVGAPFEQSSAVGINGDNNDMLEDAGAVYVFALDEGTLRAYVKAPVADSDGIGSALAMSADGISLATGVPREDGGADGIGGVPDNARLDSGAVYLY